MKKLLSLLMIIGIILSTVSGTFVFADETETEATESSVSMTKTVLYENDFETLYIADTDLTDGAIPTGGVVKELANGDKIIKYIGLAGKTSFTNSTSNGVDEDGNDINDYIAPNTTATNGGDFLRYIAADQTNGINGGTGLLSISYDVKQYSSRKEFYINANVETTTSIGYNYSSIICLKEGMLLVPTKNFGTKLTSKNIAAGPIGTVLSDKDIHKVRTVIDMDNKKVYTYMDNVLASETTYNKALVDIAFTGKVDYFDNLKIEILKSSAEMETVSSTATLAHSGKKNVSETDTADYSGVAYIYNNRRPGVTFTNPENIYLNKSNFTVKDKDNETITVDYVVNDWDSTTGKLTTYLDLASDLKTNDDNEKYTITVSGVETINGADVNLTGGSFEFVVRNAVLYEEDFENLTDEEKTNIASGILPGTTADDLTTKGTLALVTDSETGNNYLSSTGSNKTDLTDVFGIFDYPILDNLMISFDQKYGIGDESESGLGVSAGYDATKGIDDDYIQVATFNSNGSLYIQGSYYLNAAETSGTKFPTSLKDTQHYYDIMFKPDKYVGSVYQDATHKGEKYNVTIPDDYTYMINSLTLSSGNLSNWDNIRIVVLGEYTQDMKLVGEESVAAADEESVATSTVTIRMSEPLSAAAASKFKVTKSDGTAATVSSVALSDSNRTVTLTLAEDVTSDFYTVTAKSGLTNVAGVIMASDISVVKGLTSYIADADGNELDSLDGIATGTKYRVYVKNTDPDLASVALLGGLYVNGLLKDGMVKTVTAAEDYVELTVPELEDGDEVEIKAFVWDSLTGIKPLIDVVKLPN